MTQQLLSVEGDADARVDGVNLVPDAPPGAADALRDREVGPRVVGGRCIEHKYARVVADSSTSAYDAGSYFSVAERVGGAWRRVGDEIDAIDPRVGIPFDRK